ncbi:expressed unknown protein [Seminavis robusta]|uniref:Uncharacterized protein n=1 Tax=Seminavis robusta TaxID=568900 RepID=A0A9N8HWK1_9STRA|nr:expressed unknown protein [Seminavis robusta]|eukprot:Sro2199_g318760.1 n/a (198) ;mRNA; f:9724-10317
MMDYMEAKYMPSSCPSNAEVCDAEDLVLNQLEALTLENDSLDVEDLDDARVAMPEQEYCDQEDEMMSKARTVFIYKNTSQFEDVMSSHSLFSGILIDNGSGGLDLYCVVRSFKKNTFGWSKVTFDDSNGILLLGLWYAQFHLGTSWLKVAQIVPRKLRPRQRWLLLEFHSGTYLGRGMNMPTNFASLQTGGSKGQGW